MGAIDHHGHAVTATEAMPNSIDVHERISASDHDADRSVQEAGRAITGYNSRFVLEARIEQCERDRGHFVNLLAVDFSDRGDTIAVIDDYNGVRGR